MLCLWLPCGVHSVYQLSQQAIGRRYGESRIGAALLAVGVTPRLPLAKIHPRRGGISHKQKGAARAGLAAPGQVVREGCEISVRRLPDTYT